MSLLNYFLELKCAGDVLNSVYPVLNPEKEVSEAMAMAKRLKRFLISKPNHYNIFDLCAGNCLFSSLIAHLFKTKGVCAIDKKERKRENLKNIRDFENIKLDIIKDEEVIIEMINSCENSIITSIHPCSELAQKVLDIYKESKASHVVIMPCCEGKNLNQYPFWLKNKLSVYQLWCYDLCREINGEIYNSEGCLSNKNLIIVGSKDKK